MFDPMLSACPSFEPEWRAFVDMWSDEPDLPLYLALSDLAQHLLDRLIKEDVADFSAVFSVIEQWHTSGDAYVQEAATIGLLEALQQGLQHFEASRRLGDAPTPSFETWLLPVSLEWWGKLLRFWCGDTLALRDNA
ncbi:DUF7674 family protein [Asticcacaulis tiandongensis]|uniref:DUF7674 family protein n=1 Tax=Asticcacaulis tiandongensis TaxID=2565365 RepID=UPI001C6448E4|nr:hypothetical protein [Asticcacaulis tiandongensis]